jgi:phosphoglycolate phosphatase
VKSTIKAILFDKDGTYIDFNKTWFPATRDLFHWLAKGDEAAFARLVSVARLDLENKTYFADSVILAHATIDYAPLLAKAIGETYSDSFLQRFDEKSFELGSFYATPIGNPHAVFSALKAKGYILGVATNGSFALAQSHNEKLGLTPLLSFTCGYDSGFGRKPGGGMALAFAKHLALKPEEIAVVGDTLHDIHMAKAAGCLAIGVATGLTPYDVLAKEADIMIMCLEDLLDMQDLSRT